MLAVGPISTPPESVQRRQNKFIASRSLMNEFFFFLLFYNYKFYRQKNVLHSVMILEYCGLEEDFVCPEVPYEQYSCSCESSGNSNDSLASFRASSFLSFLYRKGRCRLRCLLQSSGLFCCASFVELRLPFLELKGWTIEAIPSRLF